MPQAIFWELMGRLHTARVLLERDQSAICSWLDARAYMKLRVQEIATVLWLEGEWL